MRSRRKRNLAPHSSVHRAVVNRLLKVAAFAARRAVLAEHVDLLRAGANVPEVRRARQAVVPIPPGASVRGWCALMCAMRSVGKGKGMLESDSAKRTCVSAVSPMRARCCTLCGEVPLLSPGAVAAAPPLELGS